MTESGGGIQPGREKREDADVYHSENIDKTSDELIEKSGLTKGDFDNVAACHYTVPTHWDIGKVYKRLIADVSGRQGKAPIDALVEIFQSWISRKIENFNSSVYYESPVWLYGSYEEGRLLRE